MEKEIFNILSAILRTEGWQSSKCVLQSENTLLAILPQGLSSPELTDTGKGLFGLRVSILITKIWNRWGLSIDHKDLIPETTLGQLAELIEQQLKIKKV